MVTTMLVDVEELWSKTVTSTPIIIQQTGLFSSSLFVKALPAVRPDKTELYFVLGADRMNF